MKLFGNVSKRPGGDDPSQALTRSHSCPADDLGMLAAATAAPEKKKEDLEGAAADAIRQIRL